MKSSEKLFPGFLRNFYFIFCLVHKGFTSDCVVKKGKIFQHERKYSLTMFCASVNQL
jgi:hypothetical protein